MNAYEYLQALRAALSALPDDEIDSAMRYYEDYFLDAGDENAAQVIEELGPPEQVAQAILNEYTGVARRRPERFEEEKRRRWTVSRSAGTASRSRAKRASIPGCWPASCCSL